MARDRDPVHWLATNFRLLSKRVEQLEETIRKLTVETVDVEVVRMRPPSSTETPNACNNGRGEIVEQTQLQTVEDERSIIPETPCQKEPTICLAKLLVDLEAVRVPEPPFQEEEEVRVHDMQAELADETSCSHDPVLHTDASPRHDQAQQTVEAGIRTPDRPTEPSLVDDDSCSSCSKPQSCAIFREMVVPTSMTTAPGTHLLTLYVGQFCSLLPDGVTSCQQFSNLVFSVHPPLPQGLFLDTTTGCMSGKPLVASVKEVYTITVHAEQSLMDQPVNSCCIGIEVLSPDWLPTNISRHRLSSASTMVPSDSVSCLEFTSAVTCDESRESRIPSDILDLIEDCTDRSARRFNEMVAQDILKRDCASNL